MLSYVARPHPEAIRSLLDHVEPDRDFARIGTEISKLRNISQYFHTQLHKFLCYLYELPVIGTR